MRLDIWYSGFGVRNRIDSVLLAWPSLIPSLFYGLPILDIAGITPRTTGLRNAGELPRAHKTYCASARVTADTQLSCTE
jgi:hypothetical protein